MNDITISWARRLCFILTGAFICSFAIQASPPSGKKLIKQFQSAYENAQTISCTFRMEFQWTLAGELDITEGTMLLAKENRFHYETPQQVSVSDGQTLWRFNKTSQQAIVENLKEAETGVMPREILFEYPKQFDVVDVKDAVVKDRKSYLLEMQPRDNTLGISSLKIWLDAEDSITRRMEWIDIDGNRTTYQLESLLLNQKIPGDRFIFTIPENATVYDLR